MEIKEVGNVPAAMELEEVIDGTLTLLPDDGAVTIHDGDFLVFRSSPVGTRQNKIVLAQYRGPATPKPGLKPV